LETVRLTIPSFLSHPDAGLVAEWYNHAKHPCAKLGAMLRLQVNHMIAELQHGGKISWNF
jgi:hypothetical protein